MHPFTPMFAEIADKMPTLQGMWTVWLVVGFVVAVVAALLSMIRLRLGLLATVICAALGLRRVA